MDVLDKLYLPEPLTAVLTIVAVILATGVNYLAIWSQNRRQTALLWMAAAPLLSGFSFIIRLLLPDEGGAIIANPGILTGVACVWIGCRTAAGRRAWRPALLIPGAVWLLLCCIPGFLTTPSAHFATSFLLVAALLGLALRELLMSDHPWTLARWFVSGLLLLQTTVCLGWGIAQVISTVFDLSIGQEAVDLPVSAFTILAFNLIMSFAFVAWIKEQSEWEYRRTAWQDALTGLGNRRHLDDSLEKAVRSAYRNGTPLAAVMIDVDQFKHYNDCYGHPAGDACLRAIAAALRGPIRQHDEVLRYGGEEFTVLLPETAEAGALAIAERMRLAVRAMNLPHAMAETGIVTISLGVAVMNPGQPDASAIAILDGATLIAAADRALYRAKEGGRDRIALFTAEDARTPNLPRRGASALPSHIGGV